MATMTDDTVVPFTFTYRNHRGEVSERHVVPIHVRFGSTEWHPEPQWLLNANDLDKGETREFAMKDIGAAKLSGGACEPYGWHYRYTPGAGVDGPWSFTQDAEYIAGIEAMPARAAKYEIRPLRLATPPAEPAVVPDEPASIPCRLEPAAEARITDLQAALTDMIEQARLWFPGVDGTGFAATVLRRAAALNAGERDAGQ